MPFIDDGEKARLLYAAWADIRVRSSGGTTTLMSCAERNNFKMLAYLIELGIEIDEVDDSLNTALMIAAMVPHGASVVTAVRLPNFRMVDSCKSGANTKNSTTATSESKRVS